MTKTKRNILCLVFALVCLFSVVFAVSAIYANASSSNDSNNGKVNYKIAPEIMVEMPKGFSNEFPNAVLNKSYKIPDSSAIDVYGDSLTVKTELYVHYYSETRSLINIENNAFTPKFYGIYTVCYKASDCFGNLAIKTFDIVCQDKTPLTATIKEQEHGDFYVGREVKVHDIEILNYIGDTSVEVVAKCANSVYTLENLSFVPEYAGEYTVEYTYSDYNETGKVSYVIDVEENQTPIFTSEISLPEYFILGAEYNLPSVACKAYRNNICYTIDPKISYRYTNSTISNVVSNGEFKPMVAGDIIITYEASLLGKSQTKEFNAKVVDVNFTGSMDMSKYFQGADVGVKALSYGVVASTLKDGATLDFINKVLSRQLSMSLGVDADKNAFNSFDIYLTDFENKNEKIKISFVKNGGSASVVINDEDSFPVSNNFDDATSLSFEYKNDTREVSFAGSSNILVSQTLEGKDFNGFSSDFITIEFGFGGVAGYSSIYVYRIGNQTFSNEEGDGARPNILFTPYSKGERSLGDIIEIERIYVADILDPNYSVEYYVFSPSGNYVTTIDNEILDQDTDYTKNYKFIATENGRYDVYMYISDSVGNDDTFAYSIYVLNKEGPKFNLPTGNISVKAGNTIQLHKANVEDNLTDSKDITIYVVIVKPDWTTEIVKNGATYKPNQYGVYNVCYYAYDLDGNISVASYKFTVK